MKAILIAIVVSFAGHGEASRDFACQVLCGDSGSSPDFTLPYLPGPDFPIPYKGRSGLRARGNCLDPSVGCGGFDWLDNYLPMYCNTPLKPFFCFIYQNGQQVSGIPAGKRKR